MSHFCRMFFQNFNSVERFFVWFWNNLFLDPGGPLGPLPLPQGGVISERPLMNSFKNLLSLLNLQFSAMLTNKFCLV